MHEERPIVLFCEPIPFCRPAEGIEYSVRAQGCGACCVTRATRTTKFGATMSGSRIMRLRNVLILIALAATVAVGPGSVRGEPTKPAGASKSKVIQYTGVGVHTRSVATSNPEAQKYFDQG